MVENIRSEGGGKKLDEEISRFSGVENVHALPKIYHYWSSRYLRPKLQAVGYKGLDDFTLSNIRNAHRACGSGRLSLLSVGSGNCDQEVALASRLKANGIDKFRIECVDINQDMLDRGAVLATRNELADSMKFTVADFNSLRLDFCEYDVVLANHSLHHVVGLEHLFSEILRGMKDNGLFLVNDMIGRNGHMSWPEALFYIESLWGALDSAKKFHHQLKKLHEFYPNIDCSKVGYEGVRAQDVLPLLTEYFSADVFVGFLNITRPFVGRGYGPNYDVENELDTKLISFIANLDDCLIDRGVIKPTQAIASFKKLKSSPQRHYRHWSAEYSIRWPTT